jgi:hypothetical protein
MSLANRFTRQPLSTANPSTTTTTTTAFNFATSPPPLRLNHHHHHQPEELINQVSHSLYIGELIHDRTPLKDPHEPNYLVIASGDRRKLQEPILSHRPEFFNYQPSFAINDQCNDKSLKKDNHERSWFEVCTKLLNDKQTEIEEKQKNQYNRFHTGEIEDDFVEEDVNQESSTKIRTNNENIFHFGFPYAAVMMNRLHWIEFTVGLPSENMKHKDLLEMLDRDGCIRMTLTSEMLQTLRNNENLIGHKLVRYHWKIYHIRLIEEHNHLPIEFNLQMSTPLPDNVDGMKKRQQWIRENGINMFGGENMPHYNYITIPGVKRKGFQDQVTLYVPDEEKLNSIGASRWLEVDELQMNQLLTSYRAGKNYIIPAPELKHYIADNPIQFVLIDEFKRIIDLCAAERVELPIIHDNSGGRKSVEVNATIFDQVFREKFEMYNKNQFLMRVEDIQFTLTPIRQEKQQWRKDFEALCRTNEQEFIS